MVLFRWDANRGRPICSIGIPDGYRKDFSKWFSEFKQWQDIADKCDIKLTLDGFRRSLSGDNPLIAMRMVSLYCKQVQPIELLNVIAQSRFDNETKAILMAILFSNYNQPDDEQFYDSAVNSLTEVKQGGLLIALTLAIAANDSGTYSSLMSTVKGKLDKATLALMPPVEKKANSILSAIRKRSLSIEMSAEERAKLLELLSLYPIGEI